MSTKVSKSGILHNILSRSSCWTQRGPCFHRNARVNSKAQGQERRDWRKITTRQCRLSKQCFPKVATMVDTPLIAPRPAAMALRNLHQSTCPLSIVHGGLRENPSATSLWSLESVECPRKTTARTWRTDLKSYWKAHTWRAAQACTMDSSLHTPHKCYCRWISKPPEDHPSWDPWPISS